VVGRCWAGRVAARRGGCIVATTASKSPGKTKLESVKMGQMQNELNETAKTAPDFITWLRYRYVGHVFTYNETGLGVHKRLVDETKEIIEKFCAYAAKESATGE
jgi:hypothetical protein